MADDAYSELVAELVAKHQPRNALDSSMIEIVARTMIELKIADAADVPRLANTLMLMVATLPAADDAPEMDLSKLTDDEVNELLHLQCKALDRDAPRADELLPPLVDPPVMGECEARARELGRYLDLRERGPLSERERIEVMNHFTSIGYPAGLILREVYRPMWQAEIDSAVVKAVLSAEDRMAKAQVKLGVPEPTQSTPAEPELSNVIALGSFPPFSFNGGGT